MTRARTALRARETPAAAPMVRRRPAPPSREPASPVASLAAIPAVQRKCAACEADDDMTTVQPRLAVGPAGDRFEREADGIAAALMAGEPASDAGSLAAEPRGRDAGGESIAASDAQLTSGGSELPAATRGFFEARTGRDLGAVRVHQGSDAQAKNASISARAFTYKNHVWLGAGENASPGFTMAHELAHVMHQTAPGPVGPQHRAAADAAPAVRRQSAPGATPAAKTCPLELCFAPIGVGGLGAAGFVHAKLNMTDAAGGQSHSEVDPYGHQGVADVASGSLGGRSTGTHSHVVTKAGHGTGSTCIPITATCAQVAGVKAAAADYEALDVVYNAPPGPNSNSFAEWALDKAGIATSGISVPTGALGWGYYISNPGERAKPPRIARLASKTACSMPVSKATTAVALVALLRKAETQLVACGITDVGERVHILRGIYYGTPWSKDHDTPQQSVVRTQMFNVYTGSTQPRYALECMDCGTYMSLGASQDVKDPAGFVDVGHMLIGMDARRSTAAMKMPQPVGGVTGLEASTWAGDLGGGAARLAVDRVAVPTADPLHYFKGTDYGGPINLEGDIAGYAVGSAGATKGTPAPLAIPVGKGVADTVEAYLIGTKAPAAGGTATPAGRNSRCTDFLTAMGGSFSATGGLTNIAAVKTYVSDQIESFGCWYMVNFMRQHGGIDLKKAEDAAHHIAGVSQEMGSIFVDALVGCVASPAGTIAIPAKAPPVTPKAASASCTAALLSAKAAVKGGQLLDDAKKKGNELKKDASDLIQQAEDWWKK